MDRIVWSMMLSSVLTPSLGTIRNGFPTLLTPLRLYTRLRTGLQAVALAPYTTSTDLQGVESFPRGGLFPACSTLPPLSRFPRHHWQG
jgi:hypothetical protein